MLSLLIFHRFSLIFTHFHSFSLLCRHVVSRRIFFRTFHLSWTSTWTLSLIFCCHYSFFTHFHSFLLIFTKYSLVFTKYSLVFTKYSLIFCCLLSVVTLSHFFRGFFFLGRTDRLDIIKIILN